MSGRSPDSLLTLFLCGDVMTGRGVDQILPHPGDPRLREASAQSALTYVDLAERAHGPIRRPVEFAYVWGDALEELGRRQVGVRVANLETSITRSDDAWEGKSVTYRMHPDNVPCLTAAHLDCCVLANNHVLDYGHAGLLETLETLHAAGVKTAGAGRTLAEAQAPAVLDVPGRGRVIVLGFGLETSGIPRGWAATEHRPGVNVLPDLSDDTVGRVATLVGEVRRAGDVVIASIHWGANWGFAVPDEHVRFAHGLLRAGVDIVHGHSSHHVRPLEVFEGKLILYGCGDFLDDYEGLDSYPEYRDDLTLMYFPTVEIPTGRLAALQMTPMKIRRFKVNRGALEDARWLRDTINRESRRFGCRVELDRDRGLALRHDRGPEAAGGDPPGRDDQAGPPIRGVADYNLLVSSSWRAPGRSRREIVARLRALGDLAPVVVPTERKGIMAARTSLDPRDVIRGLRAVHERTPALFRCTFRWAPVDLWSAADLDALRQAVTRLRERIAPDERWRLTIERRTDVPPPLPPIIEALAALVDRKVDLHRPDKILRVELFADRAALAVVAPDETFAVPGSAVNPSRRRAPRSDAP